MDFRFDQTIAAARADVEAALADADFVAATSALPRLGDCRLLSSRTDGDVTHLQIHRRFDAPLSRAVRAVVDPSRLTWVEHVDYDTAAHRGRHRIDPDHYADRITASFTTMLGESDGATTRTTSGTVRVKAPLVAGKVEGAIVSGLEEYAGAEADLLSRWCAGGRTDSPAP